MITSMTGYGKKEIHNKDISITVELKSINSRYFELNHKIPKIFSEEEDYIVNQIRKKMIRGKVMLSISYKILNESLNQININYSRVNDYLKISKLLLANNEIEGKISINKILSLPEVIESNQVASSVSYKRVLSRTINDAIEDLIKMRENEGNNLSIDIEYRLKNIKKSLKKIIKISNKNQNEILKGYKDKISSYFNNKNKVVLDDGRLLQEVVILIEKKDINEEIIRLNSHIKMFEDYIRKGKNEKGKRMAFLLQEFLREINTIGSKTDSVEVSHLAVNIKSEIEKIREQVQNIL